MIGLGVITLAASAVASAPTAPAYVPSSQKPPAVAREFRGAWIASVGNIDWPSERGLSTEKQKSELLTILDTARKLRLNALLLQVRPACDALYQSTLEPWSEYLTGQMGKPPVPFYDPLQFAVEEAHKRGLELHAWFNPFRAGHITRKSAAAPAHVSKSRPHLVRTYGRELWLDPGEKAVHDLTLAVILDVVRRYDVDGVVVDDYFYPYPIKDPNGEIVAFPDATSWRAYQELGGRLLRDEWRRENVNIFIQQLYTRVKSEKKWVKVGISPFGIWRPGQPESVRGLDAYARLYADSRKWLHEGWLDYMVPQLYWSIDAPEQSYPALLKWWSEQNTRRRHMWPGNSSNRIGPDRPPDEIINQIKLTRQHRAGGNVHWSIKAFLRNTMGISDLLQSTVYDRPAVVPPSPWLDKAAPPPPKLEVESAAKGLRISWQPASPEVIAQWVLQARYSNDWTTEIVPGGQQAVVLTAGKPDAIALTAIDRGGNASAPVVVEKRN